MAATTTKDAATADGAQRVPPRLKERYHAEIAPALREEFGYPNVMQIPGLVKITVNMGVGEAARDAKLIDGAIKVRVQAPALEDRANTAVCEYFAQLLKTPKSAVRILSGDRSRTKRIAVRGVTEAQIRALVQYET